VRADLRRHAQSQSGAIKKRHGCSLCEIREIKVFVPARDRDILSCRIRPDTNEASKHTLDPLAMDDHDGEPARNSQRRSHCRF